MTHKNPEVIGIYEYARRAGHRSISALSDTELEHLRGNYLSEFDASMSGRAKAAELRRSMFEAIELAEMRRLLEEDPE